MSVLYRELAALYSAFSQGKPSPLPAPAIQYADFAVWQRSWLQGEVLEEHLGYWREQFRDAPAILKLPTDHPRPAIQTYSGEVENLVLSPSLTTALKNMSQRAEATLFMTLLAAWQHLLWRYSGQDDICVGTFIANRNRPEIEELIGFFINNLALRTDLSGYPTFWELLKRVRKVTLDAYAHQDIPFEKLLQELGWKHDPGVTPLFQVMLILQNMPEPIPELADIAIQETGEWSKRAHFDLALWVTEAQDHLQMGLQYNTDLFDAPTIRRMLSHFRVLLEGIVADPQRRLANLPLFSEQERQSILRLGQTGRSASSGEQCLHQLFEEQVQQTPDTIALVSAQEQLTYAALNRRANQLAHYLRKLGIGPEARVGLCLPRCGEQIIGLLGILKAGGAYIPLDPAYPPERLAFMASDAQLTLLVTLSSLLEHVPASSGQIVCLDTDSHLLDLEPACNPANQTQPLNLAYVIYTSGSTGRPRGVALQHCSVVNFLAAVRNVYALAPGDRLLQFTSISFDISVEEIFASLTSGASLVLRSEAMLSSVPFFLDLCRQWGITILDLPTAFWHEIVAELAEVSEGLPEALRLVIIGGERAQPGRLAVWQRHTSPHRLLINTYGPTEATVVSTLHIIDSSQIPGHEIPIGRPLTNVQIAILDRFQQVVPVGVWGELAIGGEGLARGYLGSPELTAEKFSPDPTGNGTRLYRSGDLARFLPDGTIEFGGRLDEQIKLRGFRVEPGEIEAALHLHPAIHESVVLAFESSPGEKALVAYLVWKNGQGRPIDELRTFLKTLLPEHMIPTAFLSLEQLPLQPNGKIDRRVLPAPDLAPLPQARKHLLPPRDALEWQLSHIWEECLQLHPIGVNENFFELGGHSLLAVRLLSRIQKHFSRQLPLSALFQGATIEQLAALLRQQPGMPASVLVEMQPRGSKPPLFLMHPTGGNVLCYAALTRSLGEEQPVYALQARGLQGEETPLTEVEKMAALYIQAIHARQPEGPYLLGGWSSGGLLALEMAQQLQARGQKIALLVLLDTPALFSREPESGASTGSTTAQDEAAILARFVSQLGDNSKDLAGIYADLRQLT
ncbi:MAG TPA: amino acid adenylation domain-containing protein, partial [Ktedonobacteraceae bacterium]|nr:amino acid adenylation domain-containing protein [Ktedonobacteraceae bacterium]